jgi:predicted Zn-dependent peptidase
VAAAALSSALFPSLSGDAQTPATSRAGAATTRAPRSVAASVPAHPDRLTFKPLSFEPPNPDAQRTVLKNGMVVYIAEDHALPLVNIQLLVRGGRYLEPAGKEGVAAFLGELLRSGGTTRLGAAELDERLDFLAAQVSTSVNETSGQASLNCLTDTLDEALPLFVEMLRTPRFQEDRLALAKEQQLQEIKKRNDDSADIETIEWGMLLAGEDHFTNRRPTAASVAAVTRDDLSALHRRMFHPASIVAAVSGAFQRDELLRKLEAAFEGWPWPAEAVPPVPTTLGKVAAPGLYRIDKSVNQGRVSIGLPTVRRDHPDVYALEVMNEILGGSGFTSRITRSVRSDEGLAYSAGSSLAPGVYYPGRFRAAFQSKSRSVAYATSLVLDEIRRIREQPVSAAELDTIKKNLIETFPSTFSSLARSTAVFAADEFTGRERGYWTRYRQRISAVTAAEVQRVAREHLVPERLVLLVVGDQKEIALGDPTHPVRLVDLAGGKATDLALRDPLTLRRP